MKWDIENTTDSHIDALDTAEAQRDKLGRITGLIWRQDEKDPTPSPIKPHEYEDSLRKLIIKIREL